MVFKLPNFKKRDGLALVFRSHTNPHIAYKKLMLQGFFLARDHFYICDKFVHGPFERHEGICMATFPDLYVMRWLSLFLEHVFQRSRLNASAYSGILSPSTSGSGLLYPIPPCTSLYPVPARPTWPFQSPHGMRNSNPGIPGSHSTQLIKEQVLTSSLDHSVGRSHTEWYPHAGQL